MSHPDNNVFTQYIESFSISFGNSASFSFRNQELNNHELIRRLNHINLSFTEKLSKVVNSTNLIKEVK